jgi:hypothetical protein
MSCRHGYESTGASTYDQRERTACCGSTVITRLAPGARESGFARQFFEHCGCCGRRVRYRPVRQSTLEESQ